MKKFFFVLVSVLSLSTAVMAQEFEGDSIKMSYIPNSGKDNWELNVAGGVSVLFNGIGHTEEMNADKSKHFYDCVGGVGEITASKWFNPYVGVRFGWEAEYLPFTGTDSETANKLGKWNNYFHFDAMWDMVSQFGGYKADRVYNFVPYMHVGIIYNPQCQAMVGGGVGLLNRFRLAENWMFNIDLRATSTSARKYGIGEGIAIEAQALVGFSYRFNNATWKTKVKAADTERLNELLQENQLLNDRNSTLAAENESLRNRKPVEQVVEAAQAAQEVVEKNIHDGKEILKKLEKLTVYYQLGADELSSVEKIHLFVYLNTIKLGDTNSELFYEVTGRADTATGTQEFNEAIAARRAESVKKQLIENGIAEDHITTKIELVNSGDCNVDRSAEVRIVEK